MPLTRIKTTGVESNSISTAKVAEDPSRLYYANTRVQANVIALLVSLAGNNVTIEANGRISATATSGGGNNARTTGYSLVFGG
jgi:hypothetical protein